MRLLDYELDRFIEEDVPYLDLTSTLLGIEGKLGRISVFSREDGIVCGTEEVIRIFEKYGIVVETFVASGGKVCVGDDLVSGTGRVDALHCVWKVSQNVLEYASGIASKTNRMLERARVNNPEVMILATRKSFPGTRKLATKGVVAGGGLPHRLNVSESVLVFRNHLNLIGGLGGFVGMLPMIRKRACERKIIVEVVSVDEAMVLASAGVDGVQFDKVAFGDIREGIVELRRLFPDVVVLFAGGVNEDNVGAFSDLLVDGIVTSCLYSARPLDLGVSIVLV